MLWPTMPFYTLHPLVGKKITVEQRCVYACVWMYIVWLCCDCVASSFYLLRPWARQRVYSATVKKKYWHRSNFQHTSQSILSRKVMIILQFWRPWALERIYCDACMYECVCVCVCMSWPRIIFYICACEIGRNCSMQQSPVRTHMCVCVCVFIVLTYTDFLLFEPVCAGMFSSVLHRKQEIYFFTFCAR